MPEHTFHGGCHCGAVRYSAELNFDNGSIRCNCSICSKTRAWFAFAPDAKFRLGPAKMNSPRTAGLLPVSRSRTSAITPAPNAGFARTRMASVLAEPQWSRCRSLQSRMPTLTPSPEALTT